MDASGVQLTTRVALAIALLAPLASVVAIGVMVLLRDERPKESQVARRHGCWAGRLRRGQ